MVGYYPQNPQMPRTNSYWNMGAPYTSRAPAAKPSSRKVLYILAALLVIAGLFLVYKGVTSTPPKLSVRMQGLASADTAVVGIVCSPCGSVQESALEAIVGKDNYQGTVKAQFGQEVMIAKATGTQVQTLQDREWVRYIDRIE
jgi:hypothetical protein